MLQLRNINRTVSLYDIMANLIYFTLYYFMNQMKSHYYIPIVKVLLFMYFIGGERIM